MATKTAALGTIRAVSVSRQFSARSSRPTGLVMSSPVLDIFDAPTRIEEWTSRCLRPTYHPPPSATKVPQDAEISSLPPPITFDGPSGTHPNHYPRHHLMVSPVSPSSTARLFDGPARLARTRQRERKSIKAMPIVKVVLTIGATIATLLLFK
ncbi:hypothetical protein CPB85DRAFT_650864 [Mucidula mucida]|nr:hypothetical protein CPB85DRAFT_650864 [Mucidula mucida]